MAQEIEYKFLVDNDSWKSQQCRPPWRMTQGYLAFGGADSPTVRVRIIEPAEGNPSPVVEAELAVKGYGDISREEIETGLDKKAARQLLNSCLGTVVQKVRHYVREANGHMFEVDVYEGALEGLVVAEIELPSEDTPFDRNASFLGEDVSRVPAYKNAVLARDGMPPAATRFKGPGR